MSDVSEAARIVTATRVLGPGGYQRFVEPWVADLAAARRENATLREALHHVIEASPGTPESVKGYLRAALAPQP